MNRTIILLATLALGAACGSSEVPEQGEEVALDTTSPGVTFKPGDIDITTAKPQGPVAVAYRIIGTPIVGQPLGIDLQVSSTIGPSQITLDYRVNDSTAMQFTEAQPASVSIAPTDDEEPSLQQVRVVPLREGRLFLNVSASVETDDGTMSTVTAIPIQVGAAPRQIREDGTLTTDETGEAIRSLPANES